MKTILALMVFLFGCTSASVSRSRRPAGDASPKLFLQPSPVFDMECSQKSGFKVDEAWYPELFQRLPEFQNAWDVKANSLIQASEALAGTKFSRSEYSVSVVLCKWTPMGYPFIMSLRPFLKSSAAADPKIRNPLSMNQFVSLTHHELLHSLIDEITLSPDFNSAVLRKYRALKKNPNLLVHLHLMAVQKATYVKLGEEDLLKSTDALYAYIGNEYQEAWRTVASEGVEVFLKELNDYMAGRR